MTTLLHERETYEILGAWFEVYKEKGCGCLEAVFQESLEIEFELRGIPARAQVPMRLDYKGRPLRANYIGDFICYDKVIVELKAVSRLRGRTSCSDAKLSECDETAGRLAGKLRSLTKVEHERFVL